VRTLLALALLSPVAFGQDDDSVPVAPAPRLNTPPTAKKTVTPPDVGTPKLVKMVEPTPAPTPKTNPAPEPTPKAVAKVDAPTPKVVPAVEPKAEPKTDAKAEPKTDAKAETKSDTKDEKLAAAPVPAAKPAEPSFNDWTAPLYAVIAYGVLAILVVIRSYAFPPKE
jgi:hypothetical protein